MSTNLSSGDSSSLHWLSRPTALSLVQIMISTELGLLIFWCLIALLEQCIRRTDSSPVKLGLLWVVPTVAFTVLGWYGWTTYLSQNRGIRIEHLMLLPLAQVFWWWYTLLARAVKGGYFVFFAQLFTVISFSMCYSMFLTKLFFR